VIQPSQQSRRSASADSPRLDRAALLGGKLLRVEHVSEVLAQPRQLARVELGGEPHQRRLGLPRHPRRQLSRQGAHRAAHHPGMLARDAPAANACPVAAIGPHTAAASSTRALASPGRSRNRRRNNAAVDVAPARAARSRPSASRTKARPSAVIFAAARSCAANNANRSSSGNDHNLAPTASSSTAATASTATTTG
jgi:hypothetical protein